jgi:methylmalonyl-CoA mutase N-terminal domain/subunit
MTWSARRRAWEAKRLRPALDRAPERRIRFSTIRDTEVDRLYGPWSWAPAGDDANGSGSGDAAGGGGPTAVDQRGERLRPEPGRWDAFDPSATGSLASRCSPAASNAGYGAGLTMRMFAGFGNAEETNERFKYLLANGNAGLSVAYDMPTLYGYDSDQPEAEGEFGTCGVGVSSLADMEVLLEGLPLDRVSTSMTINSPAAPIWAMYIVAAEKAGVPAPPEGTLQNDILKEFVAQGVPVPAGAVGGSHRHDRVRDAREPVEHDLDRGYHIREANRAIRNSPSRSPRRPTERRSVRLRVDDFAPRLSFFFNSHSDFFEEIAKFRAARRVWYKLMTERYRAENERSTWMRFHTQTAGVSLTPQQPLNNLTRVALQALAAILGGTQSLHTDAYDEALAVPTEEAALLASPAADHR